MTSAKFIELQNSKVRSDFCNSQGEVINERKAKLRRPLLDKTAISGQELYKIMADFIEFELIPLTTEKLAGLDGAEEILDMLKNDLDYRLDLIGRKMGEDLELNISMDDVERSKTNMMLKMFEYPEYLIKKYKEEEDKAEIQQATEELEALEV